MDSHSYENALDWEEVLQNKGVHRPLKQYRNPDLWLLDATSAASIAVRVTDGDRRRLDLDPLPPRPWTQQGPIQSAYARRLHHRYASLRHHSRFPQHSFEAFSQEQSSLSMQRRPAHLDSEDYKEQPPARKSSAQSTTRPSSALAARSLERLMYLQSRRQKSAHK